MILYSLAISNFLEIGMAKEHCILLRQIRLYDDWKLIHKKLKLEEGGIQKRM